MKLRLHHILLLFLLFYCIHAAFASSLEHDVPMGVIRGEKARIEVLSTGIEHTIHDMRVFYRELGNQEYQQMPMKREGYIYFADIKTDNTTSGQMEYYLAYEGNLGNIGTLPELNPQMRPFVFQIAPARTIQEPVDFEIVILSPISEDVVRNDEVLVAVSVMGGESQIDYSLSKLYMDEVDVTVSMEFSEGLLTYVPDQVRVGRHNVLLELYDINGELLTTKEWAFRAIQGEDRARDVNVRGSFFLDNRYQNISDESDNFLRGGGYLRGNYGNLDFYTRLLLSSDESADTQPVNRFTGELQYNFSPRTYIYFHGGDFIPYYNPLAFQDKRVRGVQAGLALGFFTFDYIYGQTYRSIEGYIDTSGEDDVQVNGTYTENIAAFRPGFRFGNNARWNLNFINSREKAGSIVYGGNVRESLIVGTDLSMNFDKRKILFEASVQASIKNTDAGAPELEFEDLVELYSSLADIKIAEQAFDFLKNSGLMSVTSGLNPLPSVGMQFDLHLKYFNNNLKLSYLNIDSEFESPGNPYLLKDIRGFYITDNIRLLRNQMYLNLFYKNYKNNLIEDNFYTHNSEVGVSMSCFPFKKFPSFTLGYERYNRDNSVSAQDTSLYSYLYIEDNITQRVSLASSYDVKLLKMRNTVSANLSHYNRQDAGNKESESTYNTLTIGLRTKYTFPLTTRLSYSIIGSVYGDTSRTTSDMSRFNIRLDYNINKVFGKDALRPFVNLSFQNIDTEFVLTENTSTVRNNYSVGLVYKSSSIGLFTLRYNQISYTTGDENINDHVLNVRYEKAL